MKAFLIDPFKQTITEVEYNGDYTTIYKLIDCETFDIVDIGYSHDAVFVDDEGLINGKDQEFFHIENYHSALAGKGLVLGCDKEGSSTDAAISLEELTELVHWVHPVRINGEVVFMEVAKQ